MATLKKNWFMDGKGFVDMDMGIRVASGPLAPMTTRGTNELCCDPTPTSQKSVNEEMLVYTMRIEADPRCNPQTLKSIVLRTQFIQRGGDRARSEVESVVGHPVTLK